MQSQMGYQIDDSKHRLDLNTAQAHQVHLDQQRAELSRSHIAQQISSDQERLTVRNSNMGRIIHTYKALLPKWGINFSR